MKIRSTLVLVRHQNIDRVLGGKIVAVNDDTTTIQIEMDCSGPVTGEAKLLVNNKHGILDIEQHGCRWSVSLEHLREES